MKGDRLGEFEELTLLAVSALEGDVYGVPVQRFVERATGRRVLMGAIYSALARLEDKGYVRSGLGAPSQTRGGKPKRLYQPTRDGVRVLRDVRRVRDEIWAAIEAKANR